MQTDGNVYLEIRTPIYGIKTESRFKECTRMEDERTLTYTTNEGNRKITVKYYKENPGTDSAYVKVAHTVIIPKENTAVVKGRIDNKWLQETLPPYAIFPSEKSKVHMSNILVHEMKKHMEVSIENNTDQEIKLKKGDLLGEISGLSTGESKSESVCCSEVNIDLDFEGDCGHLKEIERKELREIITSYQNKMSKYPESLPPDIPIQHKLTLTDDVPVSSAPYRLPHNLRGEVLRQIEDLQNKGFIEQSFSPYGAPLVPVVKKDGSIRVCCDFRKLNAKTIPAKYPIPHMDDVFDKLTDCDTFTIIDLKNVYHHILIAEEDRMKTACVTETFKFQWIRMPFGLSGAAYSLSAAMVYLLYQCREHTTSFYDDVIVHSKRSNHLKRLEKVMSILGNHGIQINFGKCEFMKTEVKFLGHIVSKEGIRPEGENIENIISFSTPKNTNEVRSFLGMAGFYKRFVPNFSEKAQPLFELLKKGKEFLWDEECETGYQYIKEIISKPEILIRPNLEDEFILHTDASGKAIGFVLSQMREGVLRPVLYGGRVLTDAERRYATFRQGVVSYLLCSEEK